MDRAGFCRDKRLNVPKKTISFTFWSGGKTNHHQQSFRLRKNYYIQNEC